MTGAQLRALLNLLMVSDPWPLSEPEQQTLIDMADAASRLEGFDNWIDAYHGFGKGSD